MPVASKKQTSRKTTRSSKANKPYILNEYVLDQTRANMYYGTIVRSPVNFGKIKSIDTSMLPAGYTLYTANNIPGKHTITTLGVNSAIFAGMDDFLQYVGQPVGVLVGPDADMCRSLAKKVILIFDEKYTTASGEQRLLAKKVVKTGIFCIKESPPQKSASKAQSPSDVPASSADSSASLANASSEYSADNTDSATSDQSQSADSAQNAGNFASNAGSTAQNVQDFQKGTADSSQSGANVQSGGLDSTQSNSNLSSKGGNSPSQDIPPQKEVASALEYSAANENSAGDVAQSAQDAQNQAGDSLASNSTGENPAGKTSSSESNSSDESAQDQEIHPQPTFPLPQEAEQPDPDKIINDYYQKCDKEISDIWACKETRSHWIENMGVFCYIDGGVLNVMSPTKWPFHLQSALTSVLGLDDDRIVIRKTLSRNADHSGTLHTTILAVQCALACMCSGHPIKIMLTKEEHRYFSPFIDTKVTQRTAVSDGGKFLAMQVFVDVDAGFSNPFAQEIANRLAIAITSPYYIENLSIEVNVHASSNPPTSIPCQTIDSAGFFAMENHLNHIARVLSILPQELRLLNISNTLSIFKYKNISYNETIQGVIKDSDFNRKYAAYKMCADSSLGEELDTSAFHFVKKGGIGMSCAFEGSYFYGSELLSDDDKMEVVLTMDGKVIINSLAPSVACVGLWKNIVARTLKIDEDNVIIAGVESTVDLLLNITQSRLPESLISNVSLMTALLKKCCNQIQKQRFIRPLPIVAKKSITSSMKRGWSNANFAGYPFYSSSYGTAVVECFIDPVTYQINLAGIYVAIDCGEIVSLKDATKAVKEAIARELETLTCDASLLCDKTNIYFVQSNNPPAQIGSLIHNLIPAAFTSAVSLALSSVIKTLPVKSEMVYSMSQIASN